MDLSTRAFFADHPARGGLRNAGLVRWLGRELHGLRLASRYDAPRAPLRTPFFILASPRTGSSLLCTYLDSLPDVSCGSEILHLRHRMGLRSVLVSPEATLRHVRRSLNTMEAPIRGAKLLLGQLEKRGLDPVRLVQAFPDVRFIVLYRESTMDQFVSARLAKGSRRWLATAGQRVPLGQCRVDPRLFRRYVEETRGRYVRLLSDPQILSRSVVLGYEELAGDPPRVFRDLLCPHLGAEYEPVTTELVKQNQRPLSERISNFAEAQSLIGSEWDRHDLPGALPAGAIADPRGPGSRSRM